MNKIIVALLALLIVGGGVYYFLVKGDKMEVTNPEQDVVAETQDESEVEAPDEEILEVDEIGPKESIGTSVDGNEITAYHYGSGDTELMFVGGIHGGYEWNTVLVAYELMDYLDENPDAVPDNVMVTVVPVLNPDGLENVVGSTGRFAQSDVPASLDATVPGRFNANDVDLNRNFDCDWQASGKWQNRTVSGGTKAFSEPESQAMRDYVEERGPDAVVVWYSAAGGVFASNCHGDILPETKVLTNTFAKASGYKAYETFDFYTITGDMVNWLAKSGIPAISVLLTTHTDVEWNKNLAGVQAVLKLYGDAE